VSQPLPGCVIDDINFHFQCGIYLFILLLVLPKYPRYTCYILYYYVHILFGNYSTDWHFQSTLPSCKIQRMKNEDKMRLNVTPRAKFFFIVHVSQNVRSTVLIRLLTAKLICQLHYIFQQSPAHPINLHSPVCARLRRKRSFWYLVDKRKIILLGHISTVPSFFAYLKRSFIWQCPQNGIKYI
jgi:hypothetical protein